MNENAESALETFRTEYGEISHALAKKLAAHAWLEGWIACLTYLKSSKMTDSAVNPYIED